MRIIGIDIQNFRKLFGCHIDISKETTLFVGANNSGKTSAMDALAKFLANRSFVFNDITIAKRIDINRIGTKWVEADCEQPADLLDWDTIVPKMDIWLDVAPNEMHYVASIIPTLKWRGGKLGVRLALLPKDVSNLFNEYREAYSSARTTEHARVEKSSFNLFPKDLCEFLDRKLTTYFSIKAFILDPSHFEDAPVQPTSFEAECLTDNPLKDIVRVDMIDAQRGFADPDSSEGTEKVRKQLSAQMRNYYEKHLDPEKAPSPEDLDILEATEGARQVFDKTLALKFAPAIKELEGLGYPGISDPKLTITTKVMTSETLKHDSAVQYALSKTDNTLKLPEKYNGLGYQNLMAASRFGFLELYLPLNEVPVFNTSLRDGSISELSFLSKVISPLVQAYKGNNDFEVLKIVKEYSPLMESKKWISLDDQTKALQQVESAVDKLMELWKDDAIPTCLDVLRSIQDTGLFKLDERVDNILSSPAADESIRITALRKALSVPFTTLEKYFAYVSDNTRFATHQGVKGLEFPRVMVIIDDAEAKGFLFSYEKLFGVKLKTETDIKNEREGKDNSITRTTRLFYVACTRAQKSLAIIAYTYDCEAVKATAMKNNWFEDDEIRLLE